MLKDVTFGRYYNTDSPVHGLDPRTKLFWLILYTASIVISDSIVCDTVLLLFLVTAIIVSHVPFRYLIRGLKSVFAVIALTCILSIVADGGDVDDSFTVAVKTIQVIIASNLVSVTTKPKDIADGIEAAFGRINVHAFATVIMIAFRFIPILTSEAENIINAQKARGADFENGNIIRKAKTLFSVIIPVFVCAIRRADTLALAMDSRLYGLGKPSRLHPLCYSKKDYAVKTVTFLVFAAITAWEIIC